jgi:hypothetical protein
VVCWGRGWGEEFVGDVGFVDGVWCDGEGHGVGFKIKGVGGRIRKVIAEMGCNGNQVGSEGEEVLFISMVAEADAVGGDGMEVPEVLPLEVGFLDNVCFFTESGEIADEGKASMDVGRAGGTCGEEEGVPGVGGEATKKEDTGFFGGVGKEGGANTIVFTKNVPVLKGLAKGGVREVGGEVGVEEEEKVVESTAATSVLVWWDAQEAAAGGVGEVVAGREEEVGLKGPGVGGRGVVVVRGTEAAFGIWKRAPLKPWT